jgi:hypothetical protein
LILLIELKQETHPSALGFKLKVSIGFVDLLIEDLVGLGERGRHRDRIVKLGQSGIWEVRASLEYGLGGSLHGLILLLARFLWPWKVIVDDSNRVAIIALESSAYSSHPGIVH